MATNEMGPGPLKKARRFVKKITQGTILEDQKKPPGEKNNPFAKIGGSTKATYNEGGSAKPKCPMGMSYDFSLKKCVKPGTTDTPLDKLKKEKARMLKTTYKTGGMVNANAKLVATKSAGSKGVKAGVNPKAAASNVAKKPSKPRSKAPKKALPKAAYGMSVKGYNMGGGTGDGTQVPYGTQTFKEVTVAAPKKSKGKPKAKYGMSITKMKKK